MWRAEKTTALTTLAGEPHGFLSSGRDLFQIEAGNAFAATEAAARPNLRLNYPTEGNMMQHSFSLPGCMRPNAEGVRLGDPYQASCSTRLTERTMVGGCGKRKPLGRSCLSRTPGSVALCTIAPPGSFGERARSRHSWQLLHSSSLRCVPANRKGVSRV